MSTYDRLRPLYTRQPEERVRLMCAELATPLAAAHTAIAQLLRFDRAQALSLLGGHFGELTEILRDSIVQLEQLIADGPALCERARANGGLSDQELHVYRHDIMTPLGNVRSVARLLGRTGTDGIPPDIAASTRNLDEAARELLDIIDALTAWQERAG
ncbi:MAG: histidine kinase [Chloroflexi bacterium]|nr:histidine kinase [Chloroflexota bacterium]